MKRMILLCAYALMFVGSGFAQTPRAPISTSFVVMGNGLGEDLDTYNPRGTLPPTWIKSKVTPEQYDTLAMLNMLAHVNYDFLKGYDVTPCEVAVKMKMVSKAIHRFMNDPKFREIKDNEFGGHSYSNRKIPVWQTTSAKGAVTVRYLLYSSIDGYDAHVVLTATLRKGKKGYVSTSYQIEGLSLGGAAVSCNLKLREMKSPDRLEQISIDSTGLSAHYDLFGSISFTDPLGQQHREMVSQSVQLELPM